MRHRIRSNSLGLIGVFLFSILICHAGVAGGAVYFVSPTGQDTLSGTSPLSSWGTLAKVSGTMLKPGDKVLFEAGGIYPGQLVLKDSGELGSPITIGGYKVINGQAVMQFSNSDNLPQFKHEDSQAFDGTLRLGPNVRHIVIENLDIGAAGNYGVYVSEGTEVIIRHCRIRNTGSGLPDIAGTGIYVYRSRQVRVEACQIHDNPKVGVRLIESDQCTIVGTVLYHSKEALIRCDNARDTIIEKNLCYGTNQTEYHMDWPNNSMGPGDGIFFMDNQSRQGQVYGNQILGNVVVHRRNGIRLGGGSSDRPIQFMKIVNNTIIAGFNNLLLDDSIIFTTVENNISYCSTESCPSSCTQCNCFSGHFSHCRGDALDNGGIVFANNLFWPEDNTRKCQGAGDVSSDPHLQVSRCWRDLEAGAIEPVDFGLTTPSDSPRIEAPSPVGNIQIQ